VVSNGSPNVVTISSCFYNLVLRFPTRAWWSISSSATSSMKITITIITVIIILIIIIVVVVILSRSG
jgi:hypothetical protein